MSITLAPSNSNEFGAAFTSDMIFDEAMTFVLYKTDINKAIGIRANGTLNFWAIDETTLFEIVAHIASSSPCKWGMNESFSHA